MSVYGRSVWPLSSTTLIWFLNCLVEGTGLILQNTSILNVVFPYLSLTTHSIHNNWTKYRWSDTEKVHGLMFVVLRSVPGLLGADTEWKISTNQHKQSSWCIYLKDNKKICILTLTLWIWLSQGTPVLIKHVYSLHPQFRRIKRVCTQPSALDSWLWGAIAWAPITLQSANLPEESTSCSLTALLLPATKNEVVSALLWMVCGLGSWYILVPVRQEKWTVQDAHQSSKLTSYRWKKKEQSASKR